MAKSRKNAARVAASNHIGWALVYLNGSDPAQALKHLEIAALTIERLVAAPADAPGASPDSPASEALRPRA